MREHVSSIHVSDNHGIAKFNGLKECSPSAFETRVNGVGSSLNPQVFQAARHSALMCWSRPDRGGSRLLVKSAFAFQYFSIYSST
jgi:hypothetical protein